MVDLNTYAWIVRGKQRIATVKAITHQMTPSQIHKKSKQYDEKISLNNTSDVLRSFVRQELAICLNPEAKTGRLYKLTEMGEGIKEELMKG
ncbi:MAG: hypothetical protein KAV87_53370 [Desulfobacteraceae bacterium]|nr:hypothetical protein [Desulfobacteraceae bacterium]